MTMDVIYSIQIYHNNLSFLILLYILNTNRRNFLLFYSECPKKICLHQRYLLFFLFCLFYHLFPFYLFFTFFFVIFFSSFFGCSSSFIVKSVIFTVMPFFSNNFFKSSGFIQHVLDEFIGGIPIVL